MRRAVLALFALAMSYMLGFASAMDRDTKSMDDFSIKTEQENPI